MRRKSHFLLIALVLLLFSFHFSQDKGFKVAENEKRIALVIGNAQYQSYPLRNPVNDAKDMARVLQERGFEVTLKTDASQKQMEEAIREFEKKLQRGGVGLFYFSGHGMQVNGVNYLIPVNEDIRAENEIKYKAVDANFILSKMESAGNSMNIMILDACRDNPFARSFRSLSRGLAQIDAPQGTLIVYATSPGMTAADGEGRNGIFTKHLLKAIQERNLEIALLLREVRKAVVDETGGSQVPWESSSLMGNFYFSTLSEITEKLQLPPKPPETAGLDLTSIKKAGEERAKIEAQWQAWQGKMRSDFNELERSTGLGSEQKKALWEKYLDTYNADNPFSSEDEQLRQRVAQRIKELSKPEVSIGARVSLRSSGQSLSEIEVGAMLKKHNFFSAQYDFNKDFCNPEGDFENNFEFNVINGDKVVLAHATGLMWHQSGSDNYMTYSEAKKWITDLNSRGYAGYHDWRLPTLEEGVSLVERTKMNGDLSIDPVFSGKQRWIWTSDAVTDYSGRVWVVVFSNGNVGRGDVGHDRRYVRPVRSGR